MAAIAPTITVTRSFTLFRVNPESVAAQYAQGYYADFKLKRPSDSFVSLSKAIFSPSYTGNRQDGVFSFRDKAGAESVIATTGAVNYEIQRLKGVHPKGGRCHYCRTDFSHEVLGIIVEQSHCLDDDGRLLLIMYADGIFHSFNCMLAYIEDAPPSYRETYPHVLTYTTQLYTLMYPKAPPLRRANDWRLLKSNGGSLEWEAWNDEEYRYMPLPDILIEMIRLPFIRRLGKA